VHPLLELVPRLQMLAVFESAGRLGSFTAAARELGMTQPGVSRHISNLERTIGVELFHRSASSVRLSAGGRSLLAVVQGGFDQIDRGVRSLQRNSGTFLLAANPGFAQQWLVPHLDRLQSVLGEVDLRLRLFDRDRELDDQPADAAVHLRPIAGAPPGSRVLFPEIVTPVAAPELAACEGLDASSTPGALRDVVKLHLDDRDRQWMNWTRWFVANGLPWSDDEIQLSYNNHALVVQEAIAGRGVALAWRGLVDGLLDSGTLIVVGPDVHNPDNAHLFVPGPGAADDIVDRVADWLVALITADRRR
jgi:DNA-binding transcriptional LysR family regulator